MQWYGNCGETGKTAYPAAAAGIAFPAEIAAENKCFLKRTRFLCGKSIKTGEDSKERGCEKQEMQKGNLGYN